MDVLMTYTHLENLIESGFIFFVPIYSGTEDKLDLVLHPFRTESEAKNFASNKLLLVEPIDMTKIKSKAEISKAIEDNRCYIFNQASR